MHVKHEIKKGPVTMEDVNSNVPAEESATVEPETTQPASHQGNETAEVSQPQTPVEKTIPYSRFAEVNKGLREAQRRLAEYESKSKLSQYDPNDMEAVMAHPYVQELLIKQAKSELTSYAKDKLDSNPSIPEAVKKAILANVRGFVKESTTDVDSAKIDIDEYIDSITEAPVTQPNPKVIPVAPSTAQESASGATPMEVQEILETPVDEWTDEQAKVVADYKKSQPKR